MPIKTEIARDVIIVACTEIAENLRCAMTAAEAAGTLAAEGSHAGAIQALLDAEPHLHDARKYLELAAFLNRKSA